MDRVIFVADPGQTVAIIIAAIIHRRRFSAL
jgi:hypothetical protein